MGFFSKTCAKTHLPVITIHREGGFKELSSIVVLYADGRKLEGDYDGYGRVIVDGKEVAILSPETDFGKDWDNVKFVIRKYYDGETYDQLGKSGNEMAQGFFMHNDFLRHCVIQGGFKSYNAYKKSFNKLGAW